MRKVFLWNPSCDKKGNTMYYKYSDALKKKYGEKVYKIPVNLPVTCPNRDGTCGVGGCSYCGGSGADFEMLSPSIPVAEQLRKNMAYIGEKYKAEKFIAYFQNYSNTYLPPEDFREALETAAREKNVVEIAVSTRPDCISDVYAEIACRIKEQYGVEVSFELGLQSVNGDTLRKINRGHGLAEFLDAVLRLQKYGLQVGVHIMLGLPWDSEADAAEAAKILSALRIDSVKLHALYLLKDTPLAREYLAGNLTLKTKEQYMEEVILFLRHLRRDIPVQRLLGRAPEEQTVFCNWQTSWRKIHDDIVEKMGAKGVRQGDLCDYLNGKAVRKFL